MLEEERRRSSAGKTRAGQGRAGWTRFRRAGQGKVRVCLSSCWVTEVAGRGKVGRDVSVGVVKKEATWWNIVGVVGGRHFLPFLSFSQPSFPSFSLPPPSPLLPLQPTSLLISLFLYMTGCSGNLRVWPLVAVTQTLIGGGGGR